MRPEQVLNEEELEELRLSGQALYRDGSKTPDATANSSELDMSRVEPHEAIWSLKFERGEETSAVSLESILDGVDSLDGDDPNNGYLILEKAGSAGECTGFAQTGLTEGNYIVEIRIDRGGDFGFWKAGTKEPARGIVSEAKDGRFQTFTNEALRKEAVKAVFQHFYEHFELHPDFEWRSIKEDLEARQSKEIGPPKSTNEGKTTNWNEEELRELDKKWEEGGIVYQDPDYIPGTHPMDNDGAGVTYHHIWPPAPEKKD
jgi:hypothetical protein